MICLICRQAETLNGLTTVRFERGEMKFIVNHVPARVCPSCGESFVEEDIAIHLLQAAEQRSVVGELDDVREYEMI